MIIDDDSSLQSELLFKSYNPLSNASNATFIITRDGILKIIQILESEKVEGHDKIGFLMSKTVRSINM